MSIWPWKKPIDAAVDVVKNVADTGMHIWDSKEFTGQERAGALLKFLEATKSQATSISRRHLLWFILLMNGVLAMLAVIYSAGGWTDQYNRVIDIVEVFKFGWAFVTAVGFYFAAHILNGKGKGK
tara:strand:+ start:3155 stop:3529 length:375 start_codon:yes stop_codon:yes gene_type:complete